MTFFDIEQIRLDISNGISQNNPHFCFKQTVGAMILTKDNQKIFGANHINNSEITECPRITQNFPTGEGYHLCEEICKQNSHAEVSAIKEAIKQNIDINDSTLYLIGHSYCCNNCISEMKKNGIKKVFILLEDNSINSYYF